MTKDPYANLIAFLQPIAEANKKLQKDEQARANLKNLIEQMGFLLEETDPLFLSSPAAGLHKDDLDFLRSLPYILDHVQKMQGPKGEKGDPGESIVGPQGPAGRDGRNGKDGKSIVGPKGDRGEDGKDAVVNTAELRALADAPVKQHEKTHDHDLLHDPHMLGTIELDESNLEDGAFIKYDEDKKKFVLSKVSVPRSMSYGGGSSLTDFFRVTRTVTADYTVDPADRIIHVDCTSGPITITLHTAEGYDRKSHYIKKIDSSDNMVTVLPTGTQTIEFNALDGLPNQGSSREYYAHEGNWFTKHA